MKTAKKPKVMLTKGPRSTYRNKEGAPRAAKPIKVPALISMYAPSIQSHAGVSPAAAITVGRQILIRKTLFGVTITRYVDGCEVVYADGRKISASGPWGILLKLFRGAAK
jgi:hypothetical protein